MTIRKSLRFMFVFSVLALGAFAVMGAPIANAQAYPTTEYD